MKIDNYLLTYLEFLTKEFRKKYHSHVWFYFEGIVDKCLSVRVDCPHDYHFKYDIMLDKPEEVEMILERFEKDYINISLVMDQKD